MLAKGINGGYEEISVLHVDDDPNQFEFIKFFLNQADPVLKVTCVGTPEEVFYELSTGNYDCLVTDFQMPEMNGIELATKVREKYTTPIILYTGQGSEEVAEAAFTVGVNDYIRKEMDPSHYKVLGKRIRDTVDKYRVENLYRTVIEQTRDALSILVDGHLVFCNRSTLDLFKVKKIEDIPNGVFKDVLKSGEFFEVTMDHNRKEPVHIEVSTSGINYNGKEALLCFARDITDKKNLEISNRKSQKRFSTLVDLVPDGILTLSPLGYISFVNDTFLRLTGFEKEEILNKHLTSIGTIRKKDLLQHIQTFATIIKGNVPPPIEFHWTKKDGTPCVGQAHISLIEIAGRKEILMIARDITEEKRRQQGYKTLFEKAPDAIIEMDNTGKIMSINDMALEYTDLQRRNAIGKHFNTIYNLEEGNIETLHSVFTNSNRFTKLEPFEIKLRPPKGNSIWLEGHPRVLVVDDAEYGYQFVFRDITERRTIELQRKKYAQKLEQIILNKTPKHNTANLNQIKTELAANILQIESNIMKLAISNENGVDISEITASLESLNTLTSSINTEILSNQNKENSILNDLNV